MRAIGNALSWQRRRGSVRAGLRPAAAAPPGSAPWGWPASQPCRRKWPGPRRGRADLLAAAGVPVVPGDIADSADEAAETAARTRLPVALQICSAQITHKSDIGGVALGLRSAAEVRDAYQRVRAAGARVAGADLEGVMVTAMREGGAELLAGVTVDPSFGPVLAVGLGGIWVELLGDTSLRLLPADAAEVRRMLGELRGAPLLAGRAAVSRPTWTPWPRRSPDRRGGPVARTGRCARWRSTRCGCTATRSRRWTPWSSPRPRTGWQVRNGPR